MSTPHNPQRPRVPIPSIPAELATTRLVLPHAEIATTIETTAGLLSRLLTAAVLPRLAPLIAQAVGLLAALADYLLNNSDEQPQEGDSQ